MTRPVASLAPFAAIEALCRRDPAGRGLQGSAPWGPIEDAARALLGTTRLAIVTGFPHLATGRPETDGPLGAAAVSRAMTRLAKTVVLPTDAATAPILRALGCPGIEVLDLPLEPKARHAAATAYRHRHRLDGLLAIERPGRVADGSYRNFTGRDITATVAALDELFLCGGPEAREADDTPRPVTLAIGDGGNEVGMGSLVDPADWPGGATAPRGLGWEPGARLTGLPMYPSVVPVHWLVVAGTSNWGAYALLAAASRLAGISLLPSRDELEADLAAALEAGAVDGITGRAEATVDGLGYQESLEFVAELRGLVPGGGSSR